MNRRQEIALWVFGIVLALLSASAGMDEGEWIFAYFVPGLIIGTLVVFSLRERPKAHDPVRDEQSNATLKTGLALVLLASVAGHAQHRLSGLEFQVSGAEDTAQAAAADAERVGSDLQELDRKVSMLEIEVEYR